MAREIVLMEGFDYSSDKNDILYHKGWVGIIYGTNGTGRYGEGYYAQNVQAYKDLLSPTWEFTMGIAYKTVGYQGLDHWLSFRDSSNSAHFRIQMNANGYWTLKNPAGTVVATATQAYGINQWRFVEIYGKIADTGGRCKMLFDGDVVIDYTGDLKNSSLPFSRFHHIAQSNGYTDDIYILSNTGEDFLGDIIVRGRLPEANGFQNNWTPLSGNNYENVDDVNIDDDSTYIYTDGAGNIDLFQFQNLSNVTGTIYGLQLNISTRKDDAGDRLINPVIRSGGSNYYSSTGSVGSDYQYHTFLYEENPDTLSPWTFGGITGSQFGLRLQS